MNKLFLLCLITFLAISCDDTDSTTDTDDNTTDVVEEVEDNHIAFVVNDIYAQMYKERMIVGSHRQSSVLFLKEGGAYKLNMDYQPYDDEEDEDMHTTKPKLKKMTDQQIVLEDVGYACKSCGKLSSYEYVFSYVNPTTVIAAFLETWEAHNNEYGVGQDFLIRVYKKDEVEGYWDNMTDVVLPENHRQIFKDFFAKEGAKDLTEEEDIDVLRIFCGTCLELSLEDKLVRIANSKMVGDGSDLVFAWEDGKVFIP